jgi:uncharacterized protein YkwD
LLSVSLFAVHLAGPTPAHAASEEAYGQAAQDATNAQRIKRNLAALKVNKCLRRHAERHAAAMAAEGDIWHQNLGRVLRSCDLVSVGENVAMGYASGRSVVNHGWMKSAGHRANILRRGYRLGVVSAVRGEDGMWYAAQLFGAR